MEEKFHILVVDDEPNVLLTYRLILQQQGYQVSDAISAEQARSVLSSQSIDLLLCDLSLEKQENGFDVIEFARRENSHLPAALLTGYATVEANDRAQEIGVPVLFKPIEIQQLLQTISELLREVHEPDTKAGEDAVRS